MSRDPFYAVKDKVVALTNKTREDVGRLSTLSAGSQDYQTTFETVQRAISTIEKDTNDLAETITIVERNRAKFAAISDQELNSRRSFVDQCRGTHQDFSRKLRTIQDKSTNSQRKNLMNAPSSTNRFAGAANVATSRASDDFVNNAAQEQQQLYMQQDAVVDDMSKALERLTDMSITINSELKEQEILIDQVDSQLDEAEGNMNVVLKKMDKLLKTSDRGRICCVIGLFFFAILLLFLIVYS